MPSADEVARWAWPSEELPRGLGLLARRLGLPPRAEDTPPPPAEGTGWVHAAAAHHGCELEPAPLGYADLVAGLRAAAPALVPLGDAGADGWLVVLRAGRRAATLLTPAGARRVPVEAVAATLRGPLEGAAAATVDGLLDATAIAERRRARARAALLDELYGDRPVATALRARPTPEGGLWRQLRLAGLTWPLAGFIATHTASIALLSGSWWLLGRAIGAPQPWLAAWVLAILGYVAVRALSRWVQERLTVIAGGVIKRYLLFGATRLHPDAVRHQGIGQLMGSVIEADNVEFLVLYGGFPALRALITLGFALGILTTGASGWPHALLLLAWLGVGAAIGWRFYRERTAWNDARLATTHDLIEQMVGYRTVLTQQAPGLRSVELARALAGYKAVSAAMDRTMAWLIVLVPRGWLLLSVVVIVGALGATGDTAGAVVSLGAALLAYQALGYLNLALAHAASLAYAARRIAPFLRAARAPGERPTARPPDTSAEPLLALRGLSFRYRPDGAPVLSGCDLTVRSGERVLLEGRSGSGKSTLIALLAGLRRPEGGALHMRGADWLALDGAARGRLVAIAPQFHENHVLTGTLAFNLLLGRGWPASEEDVAEAEALCDELGLSELLGRMPAGVQQVVGETGWQLSHGERSRVYLARALLQGTDLIVLDESFAALDPETLRAALACAARRAPTLIVAAHP